MQRLPIGIQTFSEIREAGMAYVDKTDYLYQLVTTTKYAFLSRPRRFGKSLFISTLASYFAGDKALFDGLAIAELENKWESHPVVRIDLSATGYHRPGQLRAGLISLIQSIAAEYDVQLTGNDPAVLFRGLIVGISSANRKPVILIDEYDKPLVNVLYDENLLAENRRELAAFYGVLKEQDQNLRFVMLTGISRFAKVGIFSGLNNLEDVSLQSDFGGITGFSQKELANNFPQELENLAQHYNLTKDKIFDHLKPKYNGYSWDGKKRYYNPFSILNAMKNKDFSDYWFNTATPSFLYEILRKRKIDLDKLVTPKANDLVGYIKPDGYVPLIPLLFQTGYLTIDTITQYINNGTIYTLRYPNGEVERAFSTLTAAAYTDQEIFDVQQIGLELRLALQDGRMETFYACLQSFFADIPKRLHLSAEAYYHSMFYVIMRMLGMRSLLEKEMFGGRIDAVYELPDKVYIFEFKAGKKSETTAEQLCRNAMEQIRQTGYATPYLGGGRQVYHVGLAVVEGELHGVAEAV